MLRKSRGLNLRQKELVRHALRHPGHRYTIESHKNTHGVVYQTARKDLLELAKKGFLIQVRDQGKRFAFVPSERMMEKLR